MGGVYIFCDGPIGEVGTAVGTIVLTYILEFKGLRTSDNVIAPTLQPKPKTVTEWSEIDSDTEEEVILLRGKQYIRVGEAKNPGPDVESEDDVEPN